MVVGPAKLSGARVKRVEDPRLLTGGGNYLDDIEFPGTLEVAFLRSPYPHAQIRSIDTGAAKRMLGVRLVLTGKEIVGKVSPLQAKLHEAPGLEALARTYKLADWHPLAVDRVRFVGEAVAVVVAGNRYQAEDAARVISVDYDPLPTVVDVEKALEAGSPRLFDHWGDNIMMQAGATIGEIQEAFGRAKAVVRETFHTNRCTGVCLEPRGCLGKYDPAEQTLTLWTSSQIPHLVRLNIADLTGIPENKLQVIVPDIGGGFGIKSQVYPEEVLVSYLSRTLGSPVKWISDRSEDLQASIHARDGVFTVELAADEDGQLLGMKVRLLSDAGAYPCLPNTSNEPLHMSVIMPGPYRLPSYQYELFNVVTNKTPLGPYRAVGAPMATYLGEYMMDMLARQLELDPAEIRRRNLVKPTEMPFTALTGVFYDSGDYLAGLEKALEMVEYNKIRTIQKELRSKGRYLGVGIACYVELTAPGSMFYAIWDAGGFDTVNVRLTPSGKAIVATGMSCPGQGYATTLAQVVGDELGLSMKDVTVLMGNSSLTPFSWGSHSSRFAVVCGGATALAARQVREKLISVAAKYFQVEPDQIEIEGGKIGVRCTPEKKLPLREMCKLAMVRPDRVPGGVPISLEATQSYEPPPLSTPYATHIALVEIDSETGQVQILKYGVVHDCGKVINPLLVEGQILGGTAQGIGNALYEDLVYSEDGQLLTGSLMDYTIPTAAEVPSIQIFHKETPSPSTVGGVKGMGEGGAIAPPAALANAVADALSPFQAKVTELPIRPERVWRMIHSQAD